MTETQVVDAGTTSAPDPGLIMQIGMGFWPSKTLLSAVELGLFTALALAPLTGPEVAERLEIRSRSLYDFLDGLVALGLLGRDGLGEQALTETRPRRRCSSIATAPPTSEASSRWPTPGCTASGTA
jgi:hypothetical protein